MSVGSAVGEAPGAIVPSPMPATPSPLSSMGTVLPPMENVAAALGFAVTVGCSITAAGAVVEAEMFSVGAGVV